MIPRTRSLHRDRCVSHWLQRAAVAAWVLLLVCASPSATLAEAPDADSKSVLRRSVNPIWADPDTGEVQCPESQLRNNDFSDRHDSIAQPRSNRSLWDLLFGSGGSSAGSNGGFLSDLLTAIFGAWRWILLGFVVLFAAILIFMLMKNSAIPGFRRKQPASILEEDLEQQRAKISDLPFEMEQPIRGLKAQAEYLRSQGDYSQAIFYLFSYLLVELDAARCIRLERGKTNGAYIRELKPRPGLQPYMRRAASAFEWVYFGRHRLDAETFESLWQSLERIESEMKISTQPNVAASGPIVPSQQWTGAGA